MKKAGLGSAGLVFKCRCPTSAITSNTSRLSELISGSGLSQLADACEAKEGESDTRCTPWKTNMSPENPWLVQMNFLLN